MILSKSSNQTGLQAALYTGVALIVISMLFLGREQQSASFVVQAFTALVVPAFFYGVGVLVWRYLHTPLAAPGLIATGAWLVGVSLIHLYEKSSLLPAAIQPYYWFAASVLAGVLITATGHRIRIWMLVPLVPLVQTNMIWAIMGALGLDVRLMVPLSFLLVLAWWELPFKDERWTTVYRTSGVLLTAFLLLFSLWLPISTAQSLLITWSAGAVLVALLGLRHGWARMIPLAIVLLTCATIWGLPRAWWPVAWLGLAFSTVIFIEWLTHRDDQGKEDVRALDIAQALALLLGGVAALFAKLTPMMPATVVALVLFGAGGLMLWIGWRRALGLAVHIGLWLIASAWASLYFIAIPHSGMFGLWLAPLATGALLAERVLVSRPKEKHKDTHTVLETVMKWPVADLVIGLSTIILLWTALNIYAAAPLVLAVTCSIVVGIWLTAGLIYRLAALLHAALWIAPLPYALLLILAAPAIWTLPLLGFAWQLLGVSFLLLGHSLTRQRPAILAPFFIVGYFLVGAGLTVAAAHPMLLPFSLGLVVLVCLGSGVAVMADAHPIWSLFIAWLFPAHRLPYVYRHSRHLFLFLAAWLAAFWLHLMLGYTGMTLSRQGVFLVAFSGLWFLLGRALGRLPGVVGWPVSGAGWFMWLVGLLEVFFSPTEAITTMILGLVISGEALRRKALYWLPVFILQVFFTILQLTWMLALPGSAILLTAAVGISVAGMVYERRSLAGGRMTALMGAVLAVGVWVFKPGAFPLLGLILLAVIATLHYSQWKLMGAVYLGLGLLVFEARIILGWPLLVVVGLAHLVIGLELVKAFRPRRYRQLTTVWFTEQDWATPFLWVGSFMTGLGLFYSQQSDINRFAAPLAPLGLVVPVMIVVAAYTIRLRIRQLPYLGLAVALVGLVIILNGYGIYHVVIGYSTGLAALALVMQGWSFWIITVPRRLDKHHWAIWWIRPLLKTATFLSASSLALLMALGGIYGASPVLRILNALLIAAFAAQIYRKRGLLAWLLVSFLTAWYAWAMAAAALGMTGVFAHTLPLGVTLLAAARRVKRPDYVRLEWAGTLVLLGGAALNLDFESMLSVPMLLLGAHLLGLLVYGYGAGRRIPFVCAGLLFGGGLMGALVMVNLWLLPLSFGLLLLGTTILMEARGEAVKQWLDTAAARWQSWQ